MQGNFGVHYASRKYIAQIAYLELVPSEALYPSYSDEAATGTTNLGPKEAFLFTFSAPPPTQSSGFWSLTVYGGDQFLIPNQLNRYEVGDRSNLTYPDGQMVYGVNATPGPFRVLLQPADVTPPANWTSNWLPAPSGGGALAFIRKYSSSLVILV